MTRSSLVVLLVAFVAGLAGCAEGPAGALSEAGAPMTSDAAAYSVHLLDGAQPDAVRIEALVPARGVQLSTGFNAFEPTVGITNEGVVFMTALITGLTEEESAPTIVRSLDAGATWTDVGPKLPGLGVANPPLTLDPFMHVDTVTGRVFMLDLVSPSCAWMSFSDDLGETWMTNPLACGTPSVNDHPSMTTSQPRVLPTLSYPNVVHYCVSRVVETSCALSLDGGLTFGPLVTVIAPVGIEGDADGCGGIASHVVAAPDGTVYLPADFCQLPMVAVSEDDGLTWTHRIISEDVAADNHEVRIAIDEAGTVYALWMSDGLPRLAFSMDKGASWSPPRIVAPQHVTAAEFPAIAAGAPGRVAFAYVGTDLEGGYETNGMTPECVVALCTGVTPDHSWDPAVWHAYIGIMTDATSEDALVQTVTANDPVDPIARGACGRTRCDGIGDFIDLDIDAQGRPWVALVDVCTQACISDASAKNDVAVGFVGTVAVGPALRGELAPLPSLFEGRR